MYTKKTKTKESIIAKEEKDQLEIPTYEQINASKFSHPLVQKQYGYRFVLSDNGYVYITYNRCQRPYLNMLDYEKHRIVYLQFLEEIKKGDLSAVEKLYDPLFLPYSMSLDDESGTSKDSLHIPLYHAIQYKHEKVVEFLLEKIKESKQEYILFFSEQKVDESFKNTTKSSSFFGSKVEEEGLTIDVSSRVHKKYKKQTFEDVAAQCGLNSIAKQIAKLKKTSCYSAAQYHVKGGYANDEGWKFHISFLDDIDEGSKNFILGYEISCKIIMKHLVYSSKIIANEKREKYKKSDMQRGKIMTVYAFKETRPSEAWQKFAQELTEALAKAGVKPGYLPPGDESVQGSNYLSYRNDDSGYYFQEADPYKNVVVVEGVEQPERPEQASEAKKSFFSCSMFDQV